ncbi:Glycosyl transferase family 2 [Arenibacter nanhaiticus]|uniref:Glycosyl transferase family 2 n=1 Tax=Arenibacter nanhaiticus TaxID=558155 RepID=A0A1M6LYC9_9FLAO|nr:glycosyltransferase family 2 protein [Arenibacter nanhaiticus]SHJ76228.1 Glycosyl transferase family 2 [Arenibacter nanhaiticus]
MNPNSITLPKISIITVSYNQGQFIEDNIKSVLDQNYPNIEHIIIDAGSTDNTIDVLKKYDKHLNWVSEPDKGQSDGLNKGFKKATGKIIGWFNSDDRIAPGALHKVAEFFINKPDEIGIVGNQVIIDEHGHRLKTIESKAYSSDFLLNHAKGITQNSMFFKREVLDKIGYLNEDIHYAMDHDLFIRIAKLKTIPYLDESLGEFRIQANAKTAQGSCNFAKELISIRKSYGGRTLSPANIDSYYLILTEPLRRISWLRKTVQILKGID